MSSNEPTREGIYKAPNDRPTNMTEMQRVVEKTSAKGYVNSFGATEHGLKCIGSDRVYQPDEVSIPDYFRFEGISDPDDMSILYEIETSDGCRGTLIDAYGVYADSRIGEFISEVKEIHKKVPHAENPK
jgi:hypothetical protein